MNELLRDKLNVIANDNLLLNAIRAVFDEIIEAEKPKVNEVNSNVILGEKFRSYELAKRIIERGFIELSSYTIKKPLPKFNKEK